MTSTISSPQRPASETHECRRMKALTGMSTETKRLAQEFEKRLADEHHEGLVLRHDLGVAVTRAHDAEAVYGSNAVEHLAAYLGMSPDRLYKLRTFARVFDRAEVEQLAARRMAYGGRLRYHHLAAIMVVRSADERARLFERVLAESLSVRQLRTLIAAGAAEPQPAAGASRRPKSLLEQLGEVIERSQGLARKFTKWREELFDPVGTVALLRFAVLRRGHVEGL